jgi:hypothetical protein
MLLHIRHSAAKAFDFLLRDDGEDVGNEVSDLSTFTHRVCRNSKCLEFFPRPYALHESAPEPIQR